MSKEPSYLHKNDPHFLDAWMGPVLNLFCPGLTQLFYRESLIRGILSLALIATAGVVLFDYVRFLVFDENAVWNYRNAALLCLIIAGALSVWAASLFDAYRIIAKSIPQTRSGKSMGLSLFFTLLLPSLGHFYLGKYSKGIFYLALFAVWLFMSELILERWPGAYFPFFMAVEPVIWLILYYVIIKDLCSHSEACNQAGFIFIRKTTIWLLAILFFVSHIPYLDYIDRYLFTVMQMSSPSMAPAFPKGSWVIVKRNSGKGFSFNRNEVVMFRLPGRQEMMVKRVLALPGDRIRLLQDGNLLVNEGLLMKFKRPDSSGGETLEKEIAVSEDHLFLMGDNPQYSFDSFQFGLVPMQSIQGKVLKTIFPLKE